MNLVEEIETKRAIYNREEVYEATLKYFKGDTLATDAWINKYALKDSAGNLYELTPDDMHWRIAKELARVEDKYPNPMSADEIYGLLKNFKYIVPQGSPMAAIGNDFQLLSLSNCFVIGNPLGTGDSYGGICKIDEEQVHLMKRRAGVGHDLSQIRPKGSPVNNAAITSTGIVPFMERYSNSTREVAQDGRRGALMLSISINHPDAEDFIDAKMDSKKVTGANVSVRISDEFMKAVLHNAEYTQQFPIKEYSDKAQYTNIVNAKKIWDKIIHNAWAKAEPGVLFWDTIINESLTDCYADYGFNTTSTNPCGEITLCPYDSCRLLSMNLFSYVVNPFTDKAQFDYELFKSHAQIAQRLMDDIIDLEIEKIDAIIEKVSADPETLQIKKREIELWNNIKEKCEQGRRTGTGITAIGDMLAAMNKKYGTKKATTFSEEIMKIMAVECFRSSVILAKERGAFPIYDTERETENLFITRIKEEAPDVYDYMVKYGRRNISLSTIAPTGTVSVMTQTTSGIEPAFQIYYKRRRKINPNDKNARIDFTDELGDNWQEYNVFHHHFITWLEVNGYDVNEVTNYTSDQLQPIIEKSPYFGATANDVDWVEKVRMQGNIQKWITHSISCTVNIPEHVTEELVNDIYITAWKSGCKGCTIYRDGSRSGVLITEPKDIKEEIKEELFAETHAPKRPKYLDCDVLRFMNKGEKWIGFVGLLQGKPYELFTGPAEEFKIPIALDKGKIRKTRLEDGSSRYDFVYETKEGDEIITEGLNSAFHKDTHDMSRTISGVLRHGMPLPYVVELVESLHLDGDLINTWKSGVKRMLKKYIPDGTVIKARPDSCPDTTKECNLVFQEGCLRCTTCGNSKCS